MTSIAEEYGDKFLVIRNGTIVGSYDAEYVDSHDWNEFVQEGDVVKLITKEDLNSYLDKVRGNS